METLAAFERDPYLTTLGAEVLRVGRDGQGDFAVLDDTVLYPEGGGQPADHGFLDGVAVVTVQKREGEVRHYLAAAVAPGPVQVRLEWPRRFDHMQQHTGQHLLTAVAQDRFGWETTAFHLGAEVADVELATAQVTAADLEGLEEAIAAEIRAGHLVTCRRVAPEALGGLKVRSRGLPEGFQGAVRLVEIAGVDLNTCGGTHLRSTGELECLKLLGTEAIRGGTRLFFVAGARARRRLGAHERRNAELRGLLGAPDPDLPAALGTKLEQLRGLERRVRSLEEEVAQGAAAALARVPGPFVTQAFEDQDSGFLQRTARLLAAAAPDKTAFLTATREGQACFVLVAGDAAPVDLAGLGREVAALLQARGGGSGRLFQGKGGSAEDRLRAIAHLRAALGG